MKWMNQNWLCGLAVLNSYSRGCRKRPEAMSGIGLPVYPAGLLQGCLEEHSFANFVDVMAVASVPSVLFCIPRPV
jgi:hypothetical protein